MPEQFSAIQKRIEDSVTNGLGYDSRTIFMNGRQGQMGIIEKFLADYFVDEDDVKNSPAGLKVHLYEMWVKSIMPKISKTDEYLNSQPSYKHFFHRIMRKTILRNIGEVKGEVNYAIREVGFRRLLKLKLNSSMTDRISYALESIPSSQS